MDTSETYVKMCDCLEIQGQRGNLMHQHDYLIDCLWLPRQDQIQEMMYELPPFKEKWTIGVARVACPNCITLDLKDFSEDDCKMLLESMEQLWLAFYMHEKHQKTWDKEKWVDLEGK